MKTKLKTTKAQKWIEQGAPEQALDFLGNAVEQLNNVAVEKQIVFKENEEMNEQENVETVAVDTTETVQTSETTNNESMAEIMQKGIAQAIVVALKEFNDTVVAPLQAQVTELNQKLASTQTTVKSYDNNVFFGASDFMPAAAVADMIKKEFGIKESGQKGDVVVKEVDKVETVVTKKQVTQATDPNNLLSGF